MKAPEHRDVVLAIVTSPSRKSAIKMLPDRRVIPRIGLQAAIASIVLKGCAKKLTAEQRTTSAKKAAMARWAKQKGRFSRDRDLKDSGVRYAQTSGHSDSEKFSR